VKAIALHDDQGNIAAFVVGVADGPAVAAVTMSRAGLRHTEVELPQLADDSVESLAAEGAREVLLSAIEQFRVEVTQQARLVRKPSEAGPETTDGV
jgi:hypothetical protein